MVFYAARLLNKKTFFIFLFADLLKNNQDFILVENKKDLNLASGLTSAIIRRLTLTPELYFFKRLKVVLGLPARNWITKPACIITNKDIIIQILSG